jgi:hypothetical protein
LQGIGGGLAIDMEMLREGKPGAEAAGELS